MYYGDISTLQMLEAGPIAFSRTRSHYYQDSLPRQTIRLNNSKTSSTGSLKRSNVLDYPRRLFLTSPDISRLYLYLGPDHYYPHRRHSLYLRPSSMVWPRAQAARSAPATASPASKPESLVSSPLDDLCIDIWRDRVQQRWQGPSVAPFENFPCCWTFSSGGCVWRGNFLQWGQSKHGPGFV